MLPAHQRAVISVLLTLKLHDATANTIGNNYRSLNFIMIGKGCIYFRNLLGVIRLLFAVLPIGEELKLHFGISLV